MPTIDGQRLVVVVQEFPQSMGLTLSDFVERRFAADGFIVVGDFFEALRRYRYALGDAGEKRANLFGPGGAAEGDE